MPPQGRGPGPTGPANFNAFNHYQPSQQAPNPQPTPALTASSLGSHNGFPTPQNTNFNAFTSNGNHNYRSLGNGLNGGGTGSASQAAQMGFAQMGAASDFYPNDGVGLRTPPTSRIRDVWQSNLEEEMISLRSLVDRFPYISVDAEFPGIVARPMGKFSSRADYHYQTARCNIDLLKVIQIGICLWSRDGELPPTNALDPPNAPPQPQQMAPCPVAWQFNFKFSLQEDMYARESVDLFEKAQYDFRSHETNGIDPEAFGALLTSSGLVLNEETRWISSHAAYDIGFLMKLMLAKQLPEKKMKFKEYMDLCFPTLYDIRYLIKCPNLEALNLNPNQQQLLVELNQLKPGPRELAEKLNIKRVGVEQSAGSDAILAGRSFWELKKLLYGDMIENATSTGQVHGLSDAQETAKNLPILKGHRGEGSGDGHVLTPQATPFMSQAHLGTPGSGPH